MEKSKSFDCVAMKNAIQADLHREHEGLSEAEIARRRRQWLETSDSPAARWWRMMQSTQRTRARA